MPNIWVFFMSYNIYLSLSKISNVIIRIKYLKKKVCVFLFHVDYHGEATENSNECMKHVVKYNLVFNSKALLL